MDPTNAFLEIEHRSKKTNWALQNVKSVSKNFEEKLRSVFDENRQKKFWPKLQQQAAQMNAVLSTKAKKICFSKLLD